MRMPHAVRRSVGPSFCSDPGATEPSSGSKRPHRSNEEVLDQRRAKRRRSSNLDTTPVSDNKEHDHGSKDPGALVGNARIHTLSAATLAQALAQRVDQQHPLLVSGDDLAGTWEQWVTWCSSRDDPQRLPARQSDHSEQLALFAVYCWRGSSVSRFTVLSKISHISWRHLLDRGYPVGLHEGHQLALRGLHRLPREPVRKDPITIRFLRAVRSLCDFSSAHDRVLWAAAVMSFFFLMRWSEYLAQGTATKPYILRVQDVKLVDRHGDRTETSSDTVAAHIRFRSSPTNQVEITQVHAKSSSRWACPVLAVWTLVEHCESVGVPEGQPLCSTAPFLPLDAKDMTAHIKATAAKLGLDASRYDTHSLRASGATALQTAGVDSLAIQIFGRWPANAYEIYTRLEGGCSVDMATRMFFGAPASSSALSSSASPSGLRPSSMETLHRPD